jgi:predicted protein tyrosine phosphatase
MGLKIIFDRPVFGKVLILPRSSAAQFKYDKSWACISISSDIHEFPPIDEINRQGLLKLIFEDLDAVPGAAWSEAYPEKVKNLFNEEHANKILDFLIEHWRSVDLLMIHCYAGQSRSAGIGKFVCENLQPSQFDRFNEYFKMANKLVYTRLKEAFKNSFETYKKEN